MAAEEVEYQPCTEVRERAGHTRNTQQSLLVEPREITKRNED